MQTTVIYAFLVVAVAPLVGIWRGHTWARQQGYKLREFPEQQDQIA